MKSKHSDWQRLGPAIADLMLAALPLASVTQKAIRYISGRLDVSIFGSGR